MRFLSVEEGGYVLLKLFQEEGVELVYSYKNIFKFFEIRWK